MAAHAAFDIVRGAFDHDDGVVDDDADRQHNGEQRGKIDAEAERPHRGECADDGDRNRGGRHQHGAPILQKHQDHDQHQDRGLDQGPVHLMDRLIHKDRGVERNCVREPLRKVLRQLFQLCLDLGLDIERVGAGRLEDADAGRGVAVEGEHLAVALRAKLDMADVA